MSQPDLVWFERAAATDVELKECFQNRGYLSGVQEPSRLADQRLVQLFI